MKNWLISTTLIFFAGISYSDAPQSTWSVSEVSLHPMTDYVRKLSFRASLGSQLTYFASEDVVLTSIKSSFISRDKFAILGEAGRAQAVVIFDLLKRQEIDWFFCYEPQRISDTWIVYVEFYPAHSLANPTDVVLVYDLARSPSENRLQKSGLVRFPPHREDYPVQVGLPVYPEQNVNDANHYRNEVGSPADVIHVLGPPYFLLLSSKRLVFLETKGTDYNNYTSHLIAVDLFHGLEHPRAEVISVPMDRLPRRPGNPNFLHAVRLEEISPVSVRLVIPRADYGVDSLVMGVPLPIP